MIGTAWDLLCLCTCLISAIAGYVRGFVWDSGKWIGMCVGGVVAYYLTRDVELYHWQLLLGRLGLGLAVWGTWLFVLSKLSQLVRGSPLMPIDQVAGALGGVVRGGVLLLLTFGVMDVFERHPKEVRDAYTYALFCRGWQGVLAALDLSKPPE